MRIVEGGYYKSRIGEIFGPMKIKVSSMGYTYAIDSSGTWWSINGTHVYRRYDLISTFKTPQPITCNILKYID